MLWRVLQTGWPHSKVDVGALNTAMSTGARLRALAAEDEEEDEDLGEDEAGHPLSEALERQEVEAVEALLAAGVAPLPSPEEAAAGGANPLGDDFARALELLSPALAAPIVRALAPRLEAEVAQGRWLPLWLCIQLGLTSKAEEMLKEGANVRAEEAVGALKRALLNTYEGAANPYAPLDALRAACPTEECWAGLRRGAATAMLHVELHQALNFERDPDMQVVRQLVVDFGANASDLSGVLAPEFADLARVSSNGENMSPLMLLAVNVYSSTSAAKEAAELLLEFRADPNQPDEDGDTALNWALLKQHAPMAEVLARAGASLAGEAVDQLQVWSHPNSLRPLAKALAPQLQGQVSGGCDPWPTWLQVQFGLPGAAEAAVSTHHEDGLQEVVQALLLSTCCGGSPDLIERSLRSRLGEEAYATVRGEAARALLAREVAGAFGGRWPLDTAWASQLLDAGADVNMLVDLGEESEPEDWGDAEDSLIGDDEEGAEEEAREAD